MESLKQVVDVAAKIKDYANDKGTFYVRALLHDLGKGTTTKKINKGGWYHIIMILKEKNSR